jgi:type II secretory pathway component PulF
VERFRLSLPLFGTILVEENLARYAELLAMLIEAGLPLPRALELARSDIELPHWRDQFRVIRDTLMRGGSLHEGFARVPRLPRAFLTEIATGEKTGGLPDGMRHAAKQMHEDNQRRHTTVNVLFTVVIFALMVLITLIVVFSGMRSLFNVYDNI